MDNEQKKVEEIINALDNAIMYGDGSKLLYMPIDSIVTIRNAMKKQRSMRVTNRDEMSCVVYCPSCGMMICDYASYKSYPYPWYCNCCGQRLRKE